MKLKKEELIKPETSKLELSDGVYSSVIVGYMVSRRVPFNDPEGAPYNAVRFVFQLEDDSANIKCVQSPDYRISFSEKSNFYKQMASWGKSSSPDDLWQRLEKAGFIDNDEFNLDKFLGMHLNLMTTLKASKKDASKMFPEFTWTPAKKGQLFEVKVEEGKLIPCWIPNFIEDEDIVEIKAMDGFEWKKFDKDQEESSGSETDTHEEDKAIKPSSRSKFKPSEDMPC